MSLKLKVGIDNIRFDPADETTQKFRAASTIYQLYLDTEYQGAIDSSTGSHVLSLPPDFIMRNGAVRIIAKDQAQCPRGAGTGVNDDIDARIGTISIKAADFADAHRSGVPDWSEWITLFDDIEDDDFDGEFGIDDEEMPMINCAFSLNQDWPATPKVAAQTPKTESVSLPAAEEAPMGMKQP